MRAGAFHLGVDRARHDIARRELPRAWYRFMNASPRLLRKIPPSPRTASEIKERFRFRMKQAGRMKLDELHVRDRRAGPPRHGHAVAGRDVGIRRVEINLPATAGREHEPIRADRFDFARSFIQDINAEATILGWQSQAWPR